MGLYLAPPEHAAVFAVDEKLQIQALQPTAPVLPMLPGVPERRSHDCIRHGTVNLLAALNAATGKVIGKLSARHRAVNLRTRKLPDTLSRLGIAGGAVYDALVALAAKEHGEPSRPGTRAAAPMTQSASR
jgi:hypothetical protein